MANFITLKLTIEVETGLRIGGEKETFEIGGIDNTVVKTIFIRDSRNGDSKNNDLKIFKDRRKIPIIPGSSLKGRIRSIIEEKLGIAEAIRRVRNTDLMLVSNEKELDLLRKSLKNISEISEDQLKNLENNIRRVWRIFGKSGSTEDRELVLGNTIFTDLYPTEETLKEWDKLYERELTYDVGTEIKVENVIDRKTGTAQHPRKMERVIPGSKFEGYIIFRLKGESLSEEEKKDLELIIEGLKDLQDYYYLGSSGTRGYGRVKISIFDKNVKNINVEELIKLANQNKGK